MEELLLLLLLLSRFVVCASKGLAVSASLLSGHEVRSCPITPSSDSSAAAALHYYCTNPLLCLCLCVCVCVFLLLHQLILVADYSILLIPLPSQFVGQKVEFCGVCSTVWTLDWDYTHRQHKDQDPIVAFLCFGFSFFLFFFFFYVFHFRVMARVFSDCMCVLDES